MLPELKLNISIDVESINDFEKLYHAVQELLNKKVVSETLERLEKDQSLNSWVKQGLDLHRGRNEKEKCLFCQKPKQLG